MNGVRTARLFVAVELPADFRESAARLGAAAAGALGIRGVSPVRAQNAHLTLKFLGEADAAGIARAMAAMRLAASRSAPFRLRAGGFGAFPNAAEPRVLWLGADGDLAALARLRADLEGCMARAGFSRDWRDFTPHVTAARVRDRLSPAHAKRLMETAAASVRVPDDEFIVKRICLMRSDRSLGGAPVYVRMGAAELARRRE